MYRGAVESAPIVCTDELPACIFAGRASTKANLGVFKGEGSLKVPPKTRKGQKNEYQRSS